MPAGGDRDWTWKERERETRRGEILISDYARRGGWKRAYEKSFHDIFSAKE